MICYSIDCTNDFAIFLAETFDHFSNTLDVVITGTNEREEIFEWILG